MNNVPEVVSLITAIFHPTPTEKKCIIFLEAKIVLEVAVGLVPKAR
jgi:hypothetical protein